MEALSEYSLTSIALHSMVPLDATNAAIAFEGNSSLFVTFRPKILKRDVWQFPL